MSRKRKPEADTPDEIRVSGHTLVEIVERYLAELLNPAPDYGMRAIYRAWMQEAVDAHKKATGDDR